MSTKPGQLQTPFAQGRVNLRAMTITINFSIQVRDWIAHNLNRGLPAYSVASELAANKVDPELAVAMTAAVRRALVSGTPLPNESLTVDPSELEYLPMPSAV